tara:strand:- start:5792 stop:6307 length:516 start_codon:yes stop_codon:yes gene_type:complete
MKDNNLTKVLEELFSKPTYKFHIRELARIAKLNPNTVINITNKLEKEEIIKKENKKHIVEISLNLENKRTIQEKRIFNLLRIYKSDILDFLIRLYSPKSISLIGSYSKGEDIEKSDIDIVIDTNKKEIGDVSKFEKILKRKIHLLILPLKVSEEFFNNLINGIVLYGAIKK